MKLLWLTSWYPNRISPFNGDFIRRHAKAVSLYEEVHVIYVVRDEKGEITKTVLTEELAEGSLTETIVYYHIPKTPISIFDKLLSERKYRKLFKQAISSYINKNGNPALAHVQVGMKAGAIALWLKRKKNIRYVLTEHWSGFLPEAKEKLSDLPFYFRALWKKIILQSTGLSTVSNHLADAIKRSYPSVKPVLIPNVVDTTIFFPVNRSPQLHRFIHVSGLDELKKPRGNYKGIPDRSTDLPGCIPGNIRIRKERYRVIGQ